MWTNPATGAIEAVPRHSEISDVLAQKVCRGQVDAFADPKRRNQAIIDLVGAINANDFRRVEVKPEARAALISGLDLLRWLFAVAERLETCETRSALSGAPTPPPALVRRVERVRLELT